MFNKEKSLFKARTQGKLRENEERVLCVILKTMLRPFLGAATLVLLPLLWPLPFTFLPPGFFSVAKLASLTWLLLPTYLCFWMGHVTSPTQDL